MRILKNNWLRTSLAILSLVFGILVLVNAMEGKAEAIEAPAKAANQTWYFHGQDSEENVVNSNLYESFESTEKDCGIPQTICSILAPEDPLNPGHPKMDELVNASETVASQILDARDNLQSNATVTEFREF